MPADSQNAAISAAAKHHVLCAVRLGLVIAFLLFKLLQASEVCVARFKAEEVVPALSRSREIRAFTQIDSICSSAIMGSAYLSAAIPDPQCAIARNSPHPRALPVNKPNS